MFLFREMLLHAAGYLSGGTVSEELFPEARTCTIPFYIRAGLSLLDKEQSSPGHRNESPACTETTSIHSFRNSGDRSYYSKLKILNFVEKKRKLFYFTPVM